LQVEQRQHFPLDDRKVDEGTLEFIEILRVFERRGVRRKVIHVDVDNERSCILLTEAIHHGPSGDTEQPGSKLGAFTQLRDTANHTYPRILNDLSSRIVVADEPSDERPEWGMPARDQILERGRFTQLTPYRQEFVVGGAVFGCFHNGSIAVVGEKPERFTDARWNELGASSFQNGIE
jgi:hypothetical protein